MENQWKNKVAVITGAASGLGYSLAQRLSDAGVTLALLDYDKAKLKKAGDSLRGNISTYQVDVRIEQDVHAVINEFVKKSSNIDILVNCAGVVGQTNIKSHEVEMEDFEKVMAINVQGCFTTFKSVIPHMLKQGYGRILHIASIAGKEGNAGMLAYSTSKAAVIGMTKVQGKEYAGTGVTINALAPAVIRTQMVEGLSPQQVKYMTDKIPMNRCCTLDEFVDLACYIISEQNSFTTGFTFDLTGGRATY